MPHKRAKLSARKADKVAKGANLPPPKGDTQMRDMPKGAMRIINAAQVQEDFNRKKRLRSEQEKSSVSRPGDSEASKGTSNLRIGKGESLKEFSRRVETSMASQVRAAVRSAKPNKGKRSEKADTEQAGPQPNKKRKAGEVTNTKPTVKSNGSNKQAERETDRDWQKATLRKRLGDVAQAPPTLTKSPRGQSAEALRRKEELRVSLGLSDPGDGASSSKARIPPGVQSIMDARRKLEMEVEREKAVKAYRRAKEARLMERSNP